MLGKIVKHAAGNSNSEAIMDIIVYGFETSRPPTYMADGLKRTDIASEDWTTIDLFKYIPEDETEDLSYPVS
jgi:hypothetical protein